MSLYIDRKYILELSARLPKFVKKSDRNYNFRCVLCGDSKKNLNKCRAFFFPVRQEMMFKCHNCGESCLFGTFLKKVDPSMHKRYAMELYADKRGGERRVQDQAALPGFAEPKKVKAPLTVNPLAQVAQPLSELPDDNEAVVYVTKRGLPPNALNRLWYLKETRDILAIAPEKYAERDAISRSSAPRLLIPFYNAAGDLTGVTLRALRGETLRYIQMKFDDDELLTFGFDRINTKEMVYVTEGAFDSFFLPNAFAVNGVGFNKVADLGLSKEQVTLIFDNQPRNREVVREFTHYIEQGWRVVVWPCSVKEKDINEMVQAGRDVEALVKRYAVQGLMAQAALTQWKACA